MEYYAVVYSLNYSIMSFSSINGTLGIYKMSEKKAIAMVIGYKQARHLSGKGAVKVLVGNTHRKYFHFVIVGRGKKAGLRCYLNHFHYLAPLTFIHTVSTAVGQVIWAGQV